jgi:glucose/arabinose dehydrogenase
LGDPGHERHRLFAVAASTAVTLARRLARPPATSAVEFEQRAEVWGRPAALAVAKDGALLVADDTGGTIWRISYKGPPAEHAAAPTEKTGLNVKSQAVGR